MKYLRQLMIILIPYFIGIELQLAFNLPIPGSVIGLILLFLGLQLGLIHVEMIEDFCEFLLSNMSFFFIPDWSRSNDSIWCAERKNGYHLLF